MLISSMMMEFIDWHGACIVVCVAKWCYVCSNVFINYSLKYSYVELEKLGWVGLLNGSSS
jgi:hypothetical protein